MTAPKNLTHSSSFANFGIQVGQSGDPLSQQITDINAVNTLVNKLRSQGQQAPQAHPIGPIIVSNKFSAAPFQATYQAYFDTCSGFNIANHLMMQHFQFPLGGKCSITWGSGYVIQFFFFGILS